MDLSTDPIINFYENMLKKTQADLEVPQFSEIYLRLAFKVALGKEYVIDLNVLPLKEQVNVIWLSKVVLDRDQLESKSRIPKPYITYILNHEDEILTRWLNASKRSKADRAINNISESHKYRIIDRILGEWINRLNGRRLKRPIRPNEIEQQAKTIKQQLGVPTYCIGTYIWNNEFMLKAINKSGSLEIAEILDDLQNEILQDTYIEFKEKLHKFHLTQLDCEDYKDTGEEENSCNGSLEKHITETTDCSNASIELMSVDLTDDVEECPDQQNADASMVTCQNEDLTSILSDSEEVEEDNTETEDQYVIMELDEILTRWLNASKRSKSDRAINNISESHKYRIIDRILGEWINRLNGRRLKRPIRPYEIEQQAKTIKQQLGVPTYCIGTYIWNKEFMLKAINKSGSLEITEILDDLQNEILQDTYIEFKEKLHKFHLTQLDYEDYKDTREEENSCNGSLEKHITETTDCSNASIELMSVDLTDDVEECPDQQNEDASMVTCQNEDMTSILSDSEEVEEDNTETEDQYVIIELEDEELCQQSTKDESETVETSSEQDENLQDDLLMVLREETSQGSSNQSASNMSTNVANLNEEAILSTKVSSHSPSQGDHILELKTTDSIEEIVQKYQMYKNKLQLLDVFTSTRETQQRYANDFIGHTDVADEIEVLNEKRKSDSHTLPRSKQNSSPVQKKLCIDDGYSINRVDVSEDRCANDSNNEKSENDSNTAAHLKRKDEIILELNDESDSSSSDEEEYAEHITLLEIISDDEGSSQLAMPSTLHKHTNLPKFRPNAEAYATAKEMSNVVLKSNAEAYSYLLKLIDFCCKQGDYKAFEIVTNLQMAFCDSKSSK